MNSDLAGCVISYRITPRPPPPSNPTWLPIAMNPGWSSPVKAKLWLKTCSLRLGKQNKRRRTNKPTSGLDGIFFFSLGFENCAAIYSTFKNIYIYKTNSVKVQLNIIRRNSPAANLSGIQQKSNYVVCTVYVVFYTTAGSSGVRCTLHLTVHCGGSFLFHWSLAKTNYK